MAGEKDNDGKDGKEKDGKEGKYFINIEGTEYEWSVDSITTEQIRELGKLPADQPIVEEDKDGTERTLSPGETISLKPGHRFGRAPRYKRG